MNDEKVIVHYSKAGFNSWRSVAIYDKTKRYRYVLTRMFDAPRPLCCFILCNPSTATEEKNDPTVTRCCNFAKSWGFGSLVILNIFALRSTDPVALVLDPEPVGELNDQYLLDYATRADRVVAAWGVHGVIQGRGAQVLQMLNHLKPYCLTLTAHNQPGHPLYLRKNLQPFPLPEDTLSLMKSGL